MLNLLSVLMPSKRAALSADDDSHWSDWTGGARTKAGVSVNEDVALTFSTLFLCTRIIAEPIAGLPIVQYERLDKGDRKVVENDRLSEILNVSPNDEMTATTFREGRTMHQVNHRGGGFAEIVRDASGEIIELHPIMPNRVSPAQANDDGYYYQVSNETGGKPYGFHKDEILHVCGTLSNDGIWSNGIVQIARETIGGAIGTDQHGWEYFGSGARPRIAFSGAGFETPEKRRTFRHDYTTVHKDPSQPILTPKEMTISPINTTNNDNQFNETRILNRKIICELYRVPTWMMGDAVPGSSIEAQSAGFIQNTLVPWVRKWEAELAFKLLPRNKRRTHFFEHDFSTMLRGDVQTRMNAYRVGITTGVYTINDCLRLENLPTIGDEGDVHYVPANMFTAKQMQHGNPSPNGKQNGSGEPTTPGSDHTGAPADSPLDHEPKAFDPRAFDEWMRKLSTIHRDNLVTSLGEMESRLSDKKIEWRDHAKESLKYALFRLLTKESQAALTAAKDKGRDFEAWTREFYAKHGVTVADRLRVPCTALRLAGVQRWADRNDLAAWLVARSSQALLDSHNRDTPTVFTRKLEAWPTERAEQLATEVMAS